MSDEYNGVSVDYSRKQEVIEEIRDKVLGNRDFLNAMIDSLLDKLTGTEPEITSLISSLIYRKIKGSDFETIIKDHINRLAEEEFKQNIIGLLNSRVCVLETRLRQLEDLFRGMDEVFFQELKYNGGKLVYSTTGWRGEDVKFTSTCSLSDIRDQIDYIENEIINLKEEINEQK